VRFGASTFIWASPFGDERLDLCRHAAQLGFDTIEACLEDPAALSADRLASAAADAGIEVSVCGAFGPERDVSHEDLAVRSSGLVYLRACVDLAARVGAAYVAGPMYSATGKARLLAPAERRRQRDAAVESLREAADYAGARDVGLAIEPLNRFETDLVNTVEQGLALCAEIDCPNVGLLLDTFHMNIEEKSVADAIRAAGPLLLEFHACENDRGTPGSGHIPWRDVFDALDDIGFDGLITIESFTPEIEEIARAVSMWRPVAASPDALAADGLRFLRSSWGERSAAR
jgi:D-psicose/D-tagatose/L-ribulose 3-epimerase